jgi:hypothetical protein
MTAGGPWRRLSGVDLPQAISRGRNYWSARRGSASGPVPVAAGRRRELRMRPGEASAAVDRTLVAEGVARGPIFDTS